MTEDIRPMLRDIGPRGGPVVTLFRILSVCLLSTVFSSAAPAQQVPDEYKVKAAFVFHFAQLIQWPVTSGGVAEPIDVCVFSDEPWLPELQSVLDGKSAANRTIRVRVLTQSQNPEGCEVLFLAHDAAARD